MSKFIGVIVGGLEIVLGVVALFVPGLQGVGYLLISAGVGTLLTGVGTILSSNAAQQLLGYAAAARNPIAPWMVVYGRSIVGGTVVYIHEFGDSNKYLDMVIVLAAHPCQSVDSLLFDKQIIQLNGDGDSFTPLQQTVSIHHISRANDVVTVVLLANIPLLVPDDTVFISGITGDYTLNGRYPVAQIISQVVGSPGSITFAYICGGSPAIVDLEGTVQTTWPDYGRKVHMEILLGDHTDTFPGMLDGTPSDGDTDDLIVCPNNPWDASHRLLGRTSVFLRLHYNDVVFSGGLPQISFLVHGKKDILDPRSSPVTNAYTENAALCIADYLSNTTWGFKAAFGTEIPTAPLIAAANICDETVPLAAGGTEPRYALNGKFDLSLRRGDVLQNLLTSCAGRITYQGGQFVIWPAAWHGSSPAPDPGIGNMSGSYRWRSTVSIRDLFNGVKGTYISPANKWLASDIPPYAQDSIHGYSFDANLVTDSGDRRWLDIQLPFTISSATAQRICKIELLRRRQQGTGTFRYNMAGYGMATLDVISMTNQFLGWTNKLLEITAHRFTLETQSQGGTDVTVLGTEIDVQETDSSIYDWDPAEELTPQGYQQSLVPNAFTPAPPTGLTLLSDATTTVATATGLADAILVTWIAPADGYVLSGGHIECRYQLSIDAAVSAASWSSGIATFSTVAPCGFDTGQIVQISGASPAAWNVTGFATVTGPSTFTVAVAANPGTWVSGGAVVNAVWTGLPSVNPSVTQIVIHGVIDDAPYLVEIRAVNAGGVPSAWLEAGPVNANGAQAPLSWKPFGELSPILHPAGYAFGIAQDSLAGASGDQPGLFIRGWPPVNTFSQTITSPPVIDPAAVVSAATGASTPLGDALALVFAIDSAGQYSRASNPTTFSIAAIAEKAVFSATLPAGTAQYQVFVGPNLDSLIGQNIMTHGAGAATITIQSYGVTGYGPPDPQFDHFHIRAKREVHGGVLAANLAATGGAFGITVQIGLPAGTSLTLGQFDGYTISNISRYGLPSTGPFPDERIIHTATDGTLEVESSEGFGLDDLVMIRAQADTHTSTTIGCSTFENVFYPGGMVADDEQHYEVVLMAGTGAGQVRDIASNTSTVLTVNVPFSVIPDGTTMFVVREKAWTVDIVTTAVRVLTYPTTPGTPPVIANPVVTALQGFVAWIEVIPQDTYGNDAPFSLDQFREIYVLQPPARAAMMAVNGTVAIGSDLAPRLSLMNTLTALGVQAQVKTAPSGADLVMDISYYSSGTWNVWVTLTIADGTTSASATPTEIAAAVTIPANAPISLDVTGTGTTFPGADLSVMVFF